MSLYVRAEPSLRHHSAILMILFFYSIFFMGTEPIFLFVRPSRCDENFLVKLEKYTHCANHTFRTKFQLQTFLFLNPNFRQKKMNCTIKKTIHRTIWKIKIGNTHLSSNLVTTLTGLNMNDFPHDFFFVFLLSNLLKNNLDFFTSLSFLCVAAKTLLHSTTAANKLNTAIRTRCTTDFTEPATPNQRFWLVDKIETSHGWRCVCAQCCQHCRYDVSM